jgi:hypothetical protein
VSDNERGRCANEMVKWFNFFGPQSSKFVTDSEADMLLSTIHRVQPPPTQENEGMTRERYSIPYFVSPALDAVVECLPGCVNGGAKYPPRLFRELAEDYSKLVHPELAA